MEFKGDEHLQRIEKLRSLWKSIEELSEFGKEEYDIDDIFQDNDGKVLQQLVLMNFRNLKGREGNDGIDKNGVEWEMKSVNTEKTTSISTHHHLNFNILEKYRKVPWSFAVYKDTELLKIYATPPKDLERYFNHWENQIKNKIEENKNPDLNNPKINLSYIKEKATIIYNQEQGVINDPTMIYTDELKEENRTYDFSSSNKKDIKEIKKDLYQFAIDLDPNSKCINEDFNDKEIEFVINNKKFLLIKENKANLKIYLNVSNKEDGLEEIYYKRKYSDYNYQYTQSNEKGSLNQIHELIEKSFLNTK